MAAFSQKWFFFYKISKTIGKIDLFFTKKKSSKRMVEVVVLLLLLLLLLKVVVSGAPNHK